MKKLVQITSRIRNIQIIKRKAKEQSQLEEREKRQSIFGIRQKLLSAFMLPIVIIILLGVISYNKASKGFVSNYENATRNTIDMVTKHIELSLDMMSSIAVEYALDKDVINYANGYYIDDMSGMASFLANFKQNIAAKTTTSKFVQSVCKW